MLPTQRRQAILAQVRQRSAVSADDLAREFGVSVETIRRDLRRLGDKGLLDRVYGGATRPAGRSSEGSFAARSVRRMAAKRAIARLAASLVEPGETVIIDVGTTALEVARALPASFGGRVLTNSVPVAMELSGRTEIEILLCGGQLRHGDGACSGAHAEAFFDEFYADRAFLGSGGVHPEAGLTDYYPAEVAVRRTIIGHTAACYVLADSSKLGAIAVHRVCPLDRVAAVITDDQATGDQAARDQAARDQAAGGHATDHEGAGGQPTDHAAAGDHTGGETPAEPGTAEPGVYEALAAAGVTLLRASTTEREGLSEAG